MGGAPGGTRPNSAMTSFTSQGTAGCVSLSRRPSRQGGTYFAEISEQQHSPVRSLPLEW